MVHPAIFSPKTSVRALGLRVSLSFSMGCHGLCKEVVKKNVSSSTYVVMSFGTLGYHAHSGHVPAVLQICTRWGTSVTAYARFRHQGTIAFSTDVCNLSDGQLCCSLYSVGG